MLKIQDIIQGWEINSSSEFGDALKPHQGQRFSQLKYKTLNKKPSYKNKLSQQTELIRERKLSVNQSVNQSDLEDVNMRRRKQHRKQLYPIQLIMLEQQGQQSKIMQGQPAISQRVSPSTSVNCVLRRKNIYLQSILKQVNLFNSGNQNAKSRSGSVMSVNQTPRQSGRSIIQNSKYI